MASFQFRFPDKYYTVQGAETLSRDAKDELRREYTRMRDVAQKRIKRLSDSDYADSKAFSAHAQGFAKLKDLDDADLPKAFQELYKFVKASTSTVSGQRRAQMKTISTLNRAIGAGKEQPGVTKENYWRVIKILEETRKRKMVYGSDKIVTLAEATMEMSNQKFNDVLDNLDRALRHADEIAEIPELAGYDFDEIIAKLGD